MLSGQAPGSEGLSCPRCHSQDTKFCYYNNYSTTQPRHFCKNCKRYWTAGGSLRNVPVGGGLRKNKKSKLSKHVKEILSNEQLFSPGNLTTVLRASPSSSTDVGVDESNVNGKLHLPWYSDGSVENLLGGSAMPFATPQFNQMSVKDLTHIHGYSFQVEDRQMFNNSTGHGIRQPTLLKGLNQAHSDSSELSEGASEFSQASHSTQPGFPALVHLRHPCCQTEHPAKNVSNTALRESEQFSAQGNLQCFTKEQDGKPMDKLSTEDEDGELGNVINVRYPYDWEQVSEVLLGGTPDFFQMPSF